MKQHNGHTTLISIVIALFLAINLVRGLPLPYGIDGIVYGLDNETRADSNVFISVENLNNSYKVQANLREDGSYSLVINGEYGDNLVIKFWNKVDSVNHSVIMKDILHDFDIVMNITQPSEVENIYDVEYSVPEKRINRRTPRIITGMIESDNEEVEYKITNTDTGEFVEGRTYGGFGGYSEVIQANEGDEIEIQAKDETGTSQITGAVTKIDVDLEDNIFNFILNNKLDILSYGSIIFIMIAPILVIIYRLIKKK